MAKLDVVAMLLAGGEGKRLGPLTRDRAKPAVPFGGIYRLIDFTLSNCINSGIMRVNVLTQYKSESLDRHLINYWNTFFVREFGHYLCIIPPQFRVGNSWYAGTADAIAQNVYTFMRENPEHVLILSGDHVYKMDYALLIHEHVATGANLTIACLEVDVKRATELGVLAIDDEHHVVGFEEKPRNPTSIPGKPGRALASMGIYVFHTDTLVKRLREDARRANSTHDFGREIIPAMLRAHDPVSVHIFRDGNKSETPYWRDVGTLDSFYEANMDLCSVEPVFNLYDSEWPVYTHHIQVPPAKFVFAQKGRNARRGMALDSIVGPGCIISGGRVERCILGPTVRVNSFAQVEDSILMDGVNIGRHARVRRAIIDKGVHLPPGERIGYDLERDARRFVVTPSKIVVIAKETII